LERFETSYLAGLTSEERYSRLDEFFKCGFPCMVVARGLEVFPEMLEVSRNTVFRFSGRKKPHQEY